MESERIEQEQQTSGRMFEYTSGVLEHASGIFEY